MIDPRIKLKHIQCFLEIARRRSLARAAEAMALSQSAVTKILQELELILGARLVERSRKGAELTALGEAFLPRASACLAELENAVRSLGQARMRGDWTVRIGALPTVAAQMMPRAILRYKRESPEATVRLVSGPNTYLLDQLRLDALDLVVGRMGAPERMTDLSFLHLYSEPVCFVVRPGHPLLRAAHPDLSRIAEFTVVTPEPTAVIRPAVERLLISLGVGELPDRVESVSTSFGRAFVLDSDAVWIISRGVVARDLESGALVALEIETGDSTGPVGLTHRADAASNPAVELLKQCIRAVAAEG